MSKNKKTRNDNFYKKAGADKAFDIINFIILTLILIVTAYPIYFVIIASFSEPAAVSGGEVILMPKGINLNGYKEVFKDDRIMRSFLNSVVITALGTLTNLIVTLPTSYALSRDDFRGRKFVTYYYMVTMFVSGGMIPTYLVVSNLGLLDTYWALVLPGALSVFNMFVGRTFFKTTISEELIDAAKIDGASQTRFFLTIALPLSPALIAILALYYGVGHWNSYFSSLLYITSKEKYPLQLVLRSILVLNENQLSQIPKTAEQMKAVEQARQLTELMKYSLIIISSIPVMLVYPFIQKFFVKGVMIGSVKG